MWCTGAVKTQPICKTMAAKECQFVTANIFGKALREYGSGLHKYDKRHLLEIVNRDRDLSEIQAFSSEAIKAMLLRLPDEPRRLAEDIMKRWQAMG